MATWKIRLPTAPAADISEKCSFTWYVPFGTVARLYRSGAELRSDWYRAIGALVALAIAAAVVQTPPPV